jgi:hypothetical protein
MDGMVNSNLRDFFIGKKVVINGRMDSAIECVVYLWDRLREFVDRG